jgi:hypothetical protein
MIEESVTAGNFLGPEGSRKVHDRRGQVRLE